jgi:DNA-binding NtrC family response regulator
VCSEVGRGSTFSLILPAASGHAVPGNQESTGSPIQGPQIGKARVLVVEDDAAVRGATRMLLKAEGYRVMAVASLAQALQHLREGNGVDLLVTDYHLGDDETGTQVIATLREALGVSLRAVLMTGDTSSAVNALPRDPFLRIASKPIDAEQLLTLLRALLAA